MHNIPTALIRTFLTLVQTNSTIKTADMLGRSQPAISLQMQKLEDMLNVKLFNRDSKSMQLTKDGIMLLPLAQKMIEANDSIVERMLKNTPHRTIKMGIPNDISQYLWKHCISKFMKKHPDITLDITDDVSDNLIELYNKQALDLAIVATTYPMPNAYYNVKRPLSIYSSNKHSFEKNILKIITAPSGCVYRKAIVQTMEAINQKYVFSVISKSVGSTKSALLHDSDGITVSLEQVRDFIFEDEDIYIESSLPVESVNIAILNNTASPLIKNFINTLTPFLDTI